MDTHRDTQREEGVIAGLFQRVEKLTAEGKEEAAKVARLQSDLDHEATVQQGREMELGQLQEESRERETLQKQLSEAQGELEKSSELQKKDSE